MPVAYLVVDEREKILPLCASLTPQVEPYEEEGIFLGLDAVGAEKLASFLKLYKKGSYTLATSKLTARAAYLAGDSNKTVRLQRHEEAAFLASLPVDFLWPLRPQVIEYLKILGLYRIGEVASISREELCLQFGQEEGDVIFNYSRGIDTRPVLRKYPPDNLRLKRTLDGSINKEGLKIILSELLSDLSKELTRRGQALQFLHVELEEENGHTSVIKKFFVQPISVFNRGVVENLTVNLRASAPVVEIRVVAENLKPVRFAQYVLWEEHLLQGGGSGKNINVVRCLADSMQTSLPHQRICFASEIEVSRREKALSLWDPFRFTQKV